MLADRGSESPWLWLVIVGGGSAYHPATGSYRWFWWLLPVVAVAALVEVVVRRERA